MPIMVHFNFKKESINHDISIDKNKSMIQCACNKNNKHEHEVKYPEAGPVPKEPDAPLPDIASRACSM